MIMAYNSAYLGAKAQQRKLDGIANNVANVNNDGYKAMDTSFQNLIYQNYRVDQDINQGVGVKTAFTTLNFGEGALSQTNGDYDYAIGGNGFFAVRNTATGDTYYTRSGNFQISEWQGGNFYLTTATGELVLDRNMNPVVVQEDQQPDIGVFTFDHTEGFTAQGNNLYLPGESNGNPVLNNDAQLVQGMVEASNVELTKEISSMIETQRLFQMTLRMLQTADEIENTINNFR